MLGLGSVHPADVLALHRRCTTGDSGCVSCAIPAHRLRSLEPFLAVHQLQLRYELFRGGLTPQDYQASEIALAVFLSLRLGDKPHFKRVIPDIAGALQLPHL